jgi:hypothetical protein
MEIFKEKEVTCLPGKMKTLVLEELPDLDEDDHSTSFIPQVCQKCPRWKNNAIQDYLSNCGNKVVHVGFRQFLFEGTVTSCSPVLKKR